MHRPLRPVRLVPGPRLTLLAALLVSACGADEDAAETANGGEPAPAGGAATPGADAGETPTPPAGDAAPSAPPSAAADAGTEPAEGPLGRCDYVNTFSRADECKAYTGAGWTAENAAQDCQAPMPGARGTFVAGGTCGFDAELGRCEIGDPAQKGYLLVMSGDDAGNCAQARVACETFAGGTFTGAPICADTPAPPPPEGPKAFIPPHLDCRDPLPGEPPGTGPDGKVCTWTAISACTEPGRKYEDYASCDDVRTQRPYYPVEPRTTSNPDDPRVQDPAFMGELAWVTEQVAACACTCCHTDRASKNGPSDWFLEAGPIWTDTVSDLGLAILAGFADSRSFGAFPPEENFGFSRDQTGLPTTDVPRMKAFLTAEWNRRGFTEADLEGLPAFGGPLAAQADYVPQACARGEGVDPEGMVRWVGGRARYVYVLEGGADNPGVPPNLDLPEGTVWRLDVPPDGEPLNTGIPYGQVPEGVSQRFPAEGGPDPLVSGNTYYLYVLLDVGLPVTRCLFQAP
jgi:hypothetical protein